MRPILIAMLAALPALGASAAHAQSQPSRPGPARPVVVELFTSQGCSSCPPADAYLSDLARSRPDVLPLAFHVTYWNGLGWRDPFSLPGATARQRLHATRLGESTIYTPEMVVDGARAVVGSDRAAAEAAIRAAQANASAVPLRLTSGAGGDVVAEVGSGAGEGVLLLVGYDREHATAVARGENGGRTLVESNVVRALEEAGRWSGQPLRVQRPAPAGEQVVALLEASDGRIVAAARLQPATLASSAPR